MRNHTTPKVWELVSQQGKNPTITPGTGVTPVQFLLNALPTAKDNKFWYYATTLWVKVVANITIPTDTTFTGTSSDYLWQIMSSMQVQTPILGQLFSHSNTRGAVLGNIIQYMGFGYNALPNVGNVGAGGATFNVCLYYRLPFSYEFLRKPHETSPWVGFLESGTVEIKIAPSTCLQNGVHPGATVNSVNLRCFLEMIPSPEAVIHTPVHWREHITPGNSPKHVITDMGSPDGLQGIDQSRGVGLASLMGLCGGIETGLTEDSTTQHLANNYLAFDVPFRDQGRVDVPEQPFLALFEQMGNNRKVTGPAAASDGVSFPYLTNAPVPDGVTTPFNSPYSLIFPVVMPARDQETSKFQTVAGAKEMNFQYTTTPVASSRWVGCYFPQFDEQFAMSLAARINPNAAGALTAKTLNKQAGGVRGVGKLAYTRTKVR